MDPNFKKRAVAPDAADGDADSEQIRFPNRQDRERGSRRSMSSYERHRTSLTSPHSSFQRNDEARQNEEDELRRAATEAFARWRSDDSAKPHRRALIQEEKSEHGPGGAVQEVDVKKMKVDEHKAVVQRAMSTKDPDVQPFLKRLHERMDKVGIRHSTVEVRWEDLAVETEVYVGSRALPTVTNAFLDYAQAPFNMVGLKFGGKRRFPILQKSSGVLKPGRFTLLLGPPGSGKSTLLKALSNKLDRGDLRVSGNITYNGHMFNEFVPQRTSAYVEQGDVHIGELSVRETMDFSARVNGVGHKAQELRTLMEREAEQGIDPDPEMDAFMKAEAQPGGRYSVVTEFMLRLLGLDYVADSLVGNVMIRGISGGQKKRLTTGEMVVGNVKTLMMDEISTGLDSSTTYQIVQILQNFCHLRDATILLALLQPAPEVYELFDDILLLSEGSVVFHGPREEVLPFFESMGFQLPERKGIADFLQEVTSPKDQAQYWAGQSPYKFVPVTAFVKAFQKTQAAQRTRDVLDMPFDRAASPEGSLVKQRYGLPLQKILRATLRREITLVKRNAFIYGFRTFQIVVTSLMLSTLFFRTTRHPTSIDEADYYAGVLFFSLIAMLFNNWAEFSLIVDRLPVFYKQRNNLFYPAWAFAVPTMVLSIPQAVFESGIWSIIVYWAAGLAPSAGRFFFFWLITFLMHQFAVALFRLVGAAAKTAGLANAASSVVALFILINGGFILPRTSVRWWWRWFFYIDPMAWAQRSVSLNEFR